MNEWSDEGTEVALIRDRIPNKVKFWKTNEGWNLLCRSIMSHEQLAAMKICINESRILTRIAFDLLNILQISLL